MSNVDLWKGIAHGSLALLGIGNLYDPVGDLRGELATATRKVDNMVQNETIAALKSQQTEIAALYNFMSTKNEYLQGVIDNNNTLIWDTIQQENLFLTVISLSVIIIILFMIFS